MYSDTDSIHLSESLPSRERGLKYGVPAGAAGRVGSLPSRERGLKLGRVVGATGNEGRSLHGSVD